MRFTWGHLGTFELELGTSECALFHHHRWSFWTHTRAFEFIQCCWQQTSVVSVTVCESLALPCNLPLAFTQVKSDKGVQHADPYVRQLSLELLGQVAARIVREHRQAEGEAAQVQALARAAARVLDTGAMGWGL